METAYITHDFQPVFDARSRVLLLGTMPSPKSRETGFYYGHPRNRFRRCLRRVQKRINYIRSIVIRRPV